MLEKFGSNKIMPTFASQTTKTDAQRENSSVGRARPCQGRGRGFESRFSLKENNEILISVGKARNLKFREMRK